MLPILGQAPRLPNTGWDKTKSQWLCLVIINKSTNEKIGVTGFFPEWEPYKQAEVGFMLLPSFQGKGYGKESLIGVLNLALNNCNFHKIKATVTLGNDACIHLLRKVGFKKEVLIRDNYKIKGEWKDDVLLGMLSTELIAT